MDKHRVSIPEAAKLVGISRTTMYDKYISTGVITRKKDGNRVFIDLAELYRVFPRAKVQESKSDDDSDRFVRLDSKIIELEKRLKEASQQLEQANKREEFYQDSIAGYRGTIAGHEKNIERLTLAIEHQASPTPPPEATQRKNVAPPTPKQKKLTKEEQLELIERIRQPGEKVLEAVKRIKQNKRSDNDTLRAIVERMMREQQSG